MRAVRLRSVFPLLLILPASACENMMLKKASRDSLAVLDSKVPSAVLDSTIPPQTRHWEADYPVKPRNPGPLLAAIEIELRKVNPDIENTRLVSLVPAWAYSDTMAYAVIAKGRGPHRGWKTLEEIGEIYGVFWVDSTLTRPSAPIDVFGSNRLDDYDVWLQRAWGNVVVICAEGRSYGDGAMRREIEIEPEPGKVRKVAVDTSIKSLGSMGDSSCGSSGPKGD